MRVQEFVQKSFSRANLNWEDHVVIDQRFVRPAEVDLLLGDPSKAKKKLGWELKVDFDGLVNMMVDADIERWEKATGK